MFNYINPTQWVQALTDISPLALCCHSNKTHAPTVNPPNSAKLEGTPTIPPTYIQVHAVVWECGEGQTHRHSYLWPIHISPWLHRTQNVISQYVAFSALILLVGHLDEHLARKKLSSAGMVICLQRGANHLHMEQLMPLPHHHLLLH